MPKVRFKGMVAEIQGKMYEVVFKNSPKGKTIVTKKSDTPAWFAKQITRRYKCVEDKVEPGPVGPPETDATGQQICPSGPHRPGSTGGL